MTATASSPTSGSRRLALMVIGIVLALAFGFILTIHVLAQGISDGILRFLSDTPRAKIFEKDLVVPAFPSRPPAPTATP